MYGHCHEVRQIISYNFFGYYDFYFYLFLRKFDLYSIYLIHIC